MKPSFSAGILLSTLFYTTLLSTTLFMPLVVARDDAGIAAMARNAPAWDRDLETQELVRLHRDLRIPKPDVVISGSTPGLAPIHKTGPDAAITRPAHVHRKAIKM